MLSVLRGSVAVSVLALGLGFAGPAFAQSAAEVSVRMGQLEEEMRQLTGQVEELTNQVRQLKSQLASANTGAPAAQPATGQPTLKLKKLSASQAQPMQAPAPAPAKLAATEASASSDIQMTDTTAPATQDASAGQGIEQVQDQSSAPVQDGTDSQALARKAPGPKVLGGLGGSNAAAQSGDGGFQGQVLVAPGQQEPGDDAAVMAQQQQLASAAATAADSGTQATGTGSDGNVQPVALGGDTPEALYERSNESLLRRQFGDAEAGFRTFLQKYPDHALAGSAQYWLGETYYAQSDFRQAAQAFLQGYRKYPDGRRAADSLLKLGISLSRLGQTQQACAAFASVDANYPKSVDARRRAQAESKRANCAS